MQSWQAVMPEYEIRRWDQTNSPLDNAYTRETFRQQRWSSLSNYVRLYALYMEGGIYLDTDIEALKSLTPLLNEPCFLGFQQEPEQRDWVNTAVIAAEQGHAFVKMCMDRLVSAFEHDGRIDRSPTTTTTTLRELGLSRYGLQTIQGVTVYPVEYFYPYSWLEKYSPDKIKENTYCVHHWAASWKEHASLELPAPLRRLKRAAVAWIRKRL